MGLFLAGPIVDELKDSVAAPDVPAAARRALEVLVPLVYRPAMKVCTLNPSPNLLRESSGCQLSHPGPRFELCRDSVATRESAG